MKLRLVLVFSLALFACRKDAPAPAAAKAPPPTPATQSTPDKDIDNSLNLMYGAALVSRGGELDLANSAVHTMDGFSDTRWTCAPGVPNETLVYSMLGPTRIERVGVTTDQGDVPDAVAFDASMDGKKWTELATMKPASTTDRQTMDVKPTVAQYLRVRTLDAKKYYVRLRGVHAFGAEVAPPKTPSFGGCWTINGMPAQLEQDGARITGTIEMDPPMFLDGGTDNRVALVMWMQGPMWGYAAITRSPDGKHLSGLSFFAEPELYSIGEGWFGDRCKDNVGRASARPARPGPSLDARDDRPVVRLFQRTKRYALFGLVFDPSEQLVEDVSASTVDDVASLVATSPQTRFRVVAHELRYGTREQNRQHAAARLQALRGALQRRGVDLARIDFIAAGSDDYQPILRSALQRAFASRIDLLSGT